MPTYDYECQACQHHFEQYQAMSAKKLRKCPACGKPKLVRLVGMGAGVIFKGSGFYETDYKRAAAKKDASTSKDGAKDGSATTTTSDTKADVPSKTTTTESSSSSTSSSSTTSSSGSKGGGKSTS